MRTTKLNRMTKDLDMGNNKLLNLKEIPSVTKAYVDNEVQYINLNNDGSPSTLFPPFNGRAVDTSGIYAEIKPGSNKYEYSTTLSPYIGYFCFSDVIRDTIKQNLLVEVHARQSTNPLDFTKNTRFSGVTLPNDMQLIELKPYIFYKLTAYLLSGTKLMNFYFEEFTSTSSEVEVLFTGLTNYQPCKALAYGTVAFKVAIKMDNIALSKVLTKRTIEVEVMGAYKPGFM